MKADDFMQLGKIMTPKKPEGTIRSSAPLHEALENMAQNDFSQLLVASKDGTVLGLLSYESICRGMRLLLQQEKRKGTPDALDVDVRCFVEDASRLQQADSLHNALDMLAARSAVLVVDQNKEVVGIITYYDTSKYYQRMTGPFLAVREIEQSLRTIIGEALPGQEFGHAIQRGAVYCRCDNDKKKLRTAEDLTFGQCIELMTSRAVGESFTRYSFDEVIRTMLDPVVALRNDVFHFRREASRFDCQRLDHVRDWLRAILREHHLEPQREEADMKEVVIADDLRSFLGEADRSTQKTFLLCDVDSPTPYLIAKELAEDTWHVVQVTAPAEEPSPHRFDLDEEGYLFEMSKGGRRYPSVTPTGFAHALLLHNVVRPRLIELYERQEGLPLIRRYEKFQQAFLYVALIDPEAMGTLDPITLREVQHLLDLRASPFDRDSILWRWYQYVCREEAYATRKAEALKTATPPKSPLEPAIRELEEAGFERHQSAARGE